MSGSARPPPAPTVPTSPIMATKHRRARSRRKLIAPKVGSLYDILHDHAGFSLMVAPVCWSDLHTKLLGCRFTKLPPQKTPTPTQSSSPRSKPTPPTMKKIGKSLTTLMSAEKGRLQGPHTCALKYILATFFPNHLSGPKAPCDFDIRFGARRCERAVRCHAIWKHPGSTETSFDSMATCSGRSASSLLGSININSSQQSAAHDAPVLAYISRTHLNFFRRNCYRIFPGPGGSNIPVESLYARRAKALMPKNQDEDQYILAAMIAVAQKSAYNTSGFTPRDVKLRVIVPTEKDESEKDESGENDALIIYTGTVPAALLRMLHEPEKAPQGDTEIRIDYTHVPVWPVLGFKERLGQALGHEVVGDFHAAKATTASMETYEHELIATPETPSPKVTPSPKRRRDVLTEVFNASFSEDRDFDGPAVPVSKRRRLAESRLEAVR